jgi:hypothetical protein
MFSTSIVKKKSKNPTETACSTQKHNKMAGTPNQPIKWKKNTKKSMLSTSKVERSQKFVWRLPVKIFPGSQKR